LFFTNKSLMMSGLKSFMCSTCLCSFGCMTATHKCPHCRKPFEYTPQDYHRQVVLWAHQCGSLFFRRWWRKPTTPSPNKFSFLVDYYKGVYLVSLCIYLPGCCLSLNFLLVRLISRHLFLGTISFVYFFDPPKR
jgi:hypothetical protein